MALQQFRDRQKLIYWIIAIVVVPSFVLLGFTGAFMPDPRDGVAGAIYGKKCSFTDFQQFQRRLYGMYRHIPTYLGTIDQQGQFRPMYNETVSAFLMMALAKDAERHGVVVTEDEISTFIRAQIQYNGKDNKEFRARIQREINNRTIGCGNIFEYQQAIRENLLARKFLALLDDSIIVPNTFAETLYAQEQTEYAYQRAFVSAAGQNAAAKEEINKLPEAEILTRAADFIKTNQVSSNRNSYRYLWEEPRWKIEYITVPFKVPGREPKITPEKLKIYFDAHKNNYKDDKGKEQTLDAVKDKVTADLIRQERAQNAQNTLKREVDDFIRRREKTLSDQDASTTVSLKDLNSDPRLASLALKAGSSGETFRTIEEIFADKALKDFAMNASYVFGALDSQILAKADNAGAKAKNDKNATDKSIAEAKQKAIDDFLTGYRKTFHGQSFGPNMAETPLSCENGLLKFRITGYLPGAPKQLKLADGKTNSKLLEAIKETLIEQLALTKAEKIAQNVKNAMKEGKKPEVEVKDAKANFRMLQGQALAQLRSATPGSVLEPARQMYPEPGYEVLKAVSVNIPDTGKKEKEISGIQRYINLTSRSGQAYTPENIVSPWVLMGMRSDSYIREILNEGKLYLNPALLRSRDEE